MLDFQRSGHIIMCNYTAPYNTYMYNGAPHKGTALKKMKTPL